MFDFYTVSGALLAVAGIFGLIGWKTNRKVNGVQTPIKMEPAFNDPKPDPEPEKPATELSTRFDLTNINRIIRPTSDRKRNVGGRSSISELDFIRFEAMEEKVTYKWAHNVKTNGPCSLTVNGGGTTSSKFIDLKLQRKSFHIESMAFGSITCEVIADGKVIATGHSTVKLGIMPAGILL